MRIRSIKPEFWRSEDIAELDWHDRLVFIGMWSYVDDNGVGRDRIAAIAADLFAEDLCGDSTETLRRVSLALERLTSAGLITRYSVDGTRYLYVTNWEKHQLVKNPNKPRYPLPTSENTVDEENLPQSSPGSTENLPTGTGEQGNRGTGEQKEEADASSSSETAPPPRPEVEKLCRHLADRMIANGCKPPTIGKKWLDDARLLLDTDKRDFNEAMALIDWCQRHHFWRSNIKSMTKFRSQYDTLRLQREDQGKSPNQSRAPDWRDVSNQNHSGWTKGNR